MAFAKVKASLRWTICTLLFILNILHFPKFALGFAPSTIRVSGRTNRYCIAKRQQQLSLQAVPVASLPVLLSSTSALGQQSEQSNHDENEAKQNLRSQLRKITGFSFTALRKTLRATTGVSLTAVYASAVAATSVLIRTAMKTVLSIFPTWFRYFLQPLLVMYYVPLYVVRSLTGPTRRIAKAKHELIVEGFRDAVKAAEDANHGYWSVHVNDEGFIEPVDSSTVQNDFNLLEAVAESVELAMERTA